MAFLKVKPKVNKKSEPRPGFIGQVRALTRAGNIRLSSDTIHAMRYDTYHSLSTQTQLHLEALFL